MFGCWPAWVLGPAPSGGTGSVGTWFHAGWPPRGQWCLPCHSTTTVVISVQNLFVFHHQRRTGLPQHNCTGSKPRENFDGHADDMCEPCAFSEHSQHAWGPTDQGCLSVPCSMTLSGGFLTINMFAKHHYKWWANVYGIYSQQQWRFHACCRMCGDNSPSTKAETWQ